MIELNKIGSMVSIVLLLLAFQVNAEEASKEVTYRSIFSYETTDHYQYSNVTIRTEEVAGLLAISASVDLFFGDVAENEYVTYEYQSVGYDIFTHKFTLISDSSDLILKGKLINNEVSGSWQTAEGKHLGTFVGQSPNWPKPPIAKTLVTSLGGVYRGNIVNTNPNTNMPSRVEFHFSTLPLSLELVGFVRYYFEEFGSQGYADRELVDIDFDVFVTRDFFASTELGLNYTGSLSRDGEFDGKISSDDLGEIGTIHLGKMSRE